MDADDQVRMAENEAVFREVNETVAESATAEGPSERITFLCECADEFCVAALDLTLDSYERVRSVAEHFAVAPEHVLPEIELVVERYANYWVIRKLGVAGEVAEETDPRADE